MMTSDDAFSEYDNKISLSIGRNESYKPEIKKSIKDNSFFMRFKDEDKLYLTNIVTKYIARIDNKAEEEILINKLSENSGFTKSTIKGMIKDEREYNLQQIKEDNKRWSKIMNVQKGSIKVTDYMSNVEMFYEEQPFFYDAYRIFWIWDKDELKYSIVDEVDLMNKLDAVLDLYGQTITSGIKNNYIEAMKRVGRLHKPKDAPLKWIQFKDKAYSIKSGKVYDVTPDYFFTNPIPFKIGTIEDTPIMDKLFSEWVGDNKEVLYEILAYCCYRSYPIQTMFFLYGSGANGKTQYLAIMEHFFGRDNCTAVELNGLIDNRFESFKLYKKLVCQIGETNYSIITKSSLLKKLADGSLIGFEKKNKDPFEERNYAKIVIATNSVPSSDDTSDGWYRRCQIIDFPNQFKEVGFPIWETIPEEEYSNLALKLCLKLNNLLKRGTFTNQGTIEDRKDKYLSASNPLSLFINQFCERGEDKFESYSKVFTFYISFLAKRKQRKVKPKEFKSALEDEGIWVEKTTRLVEGEYKGGLYIIGLNLKKDLNYSLYSHYSNFYTLSHTLPIEGISKHGIMGTLGTNEENEKLIFDSKKTGDIVYNKCENCGFSPIYINSENEKFCKNCTPKNTPPN
jgi:P4 family phage/plasmid primase-like protien